MMNERNDKIFLDILNENDLPLFKDSLKAKIIEKIAWNYYKEVEEDIKKQLNINIINNKKECKK